ncbi:hypothetical protein KP509_03G096000 [Ceratopteris richardii]|nr:hypothetical protein KP509_03G096000 [Ceratopteris richardii]
MKEAIGADATGGAAEELMRSISTGPHKRFASSGAQDYDNIAGTVRNGVGEDQMSMDFMEHIDSGDYMDHLEGGGVGGELVKKGSRRLGYDQVKALEKAFELENRLEPERKTRLAAQLGLQPRQVAVWFQNRRARWKTKQMERDYALLKNKFEALKADRNKLLQEKDHLQAELARLKGQALVQEGYALSNPRTSNAEQHQQDSPTMASGSLVDDAAPASQSMSKQGRDENVQAEDEDEHDQEEGEGEKIEEDQEGSLKPVSNNVSTPHEQKLHLHNDSLSSTEGSDINNDEAIANSTSKAFHEETDFYAQHWRLPAAAAPSQLVYKPTTSTTITTTTTTKNEHEWQEQGENMGPFNMSLDTNWYNW